MVYLSVFIRVGCFWLGYFGVLASFFVMFSKEKNGRIWKIGYSMVFSSHLMVPSYLAWDSDFRMPFFIRDGKKKILM